MFFSFLFHITTFLIDWCPAVVVVVVVIIVVDVVVVRLVSRLIFRCAVASLYEVVSVRPSVRLSVPCFFLEVEKYAFWAHLVPCIHYGPERAVVGA